MKYPLKAAGALLLLLTLFTPLLLSGELLIAGDANYEAYKIVKLKAVGVPEKSGILWEVTPSDISKASCVPDDADYIEFVGKPGTYEISLLTAKLNPDGKTVLRRATRKIIIGTPIPTPTPTPTPTPEPTPTPTPTPSPAPITEPGFRVLITFDSAKQLDLDPKQLDVLYSSEVANYLNKKCIMGPKTSDWRVWPIDTDTSKGSDVLQKAFKRQEEGVGESHVGKRTTLPWIIVSNGTTGYEGPLPKTIAETMTLLKKYGGE